MSQNDTNDSFVFSNKQTGQIPTTSTNTNSMDQTNINPTLNSSSYNNPTSTNDNSTVSSNASDSVQVQENSLPKISTFSDPQDNLGSLAIDSLSAIQSNLDNATPSPTDQEVETNINLNITNPNLDSVTPIQTVNPQPDTTTNNAIPDFRSLAEEIMAEQSSTKQSDYPQPVTEITQTLQGNNDQTNPANSPSMQQQTQAYQPNNEVKNEEPKLTPDPFVQPIKEKDVEEEREALEILINSSRIDPELKDHLKIELLKFKNMETDLAPINQNVNNINTENMTPEPATPIVNPVQEIPPQPPM